MRCRVCDLVLVCLAEGNDHAVENNLPLKQEGGEAAQGEGAGKHLFEHTCCCFIVMVITKFKFDTFAVAAPSSSLKDQATTDPHESDAQKGKVDPCGDLEYSFK